MTTVHAEPYISVLGKEDSLLLLASTPVAWVAYCHGTRPLLVPVNVPVLDGEVVFRTGYGDKLAAAARGQAAHRGGVVHRLAGPHGLVGDGQRT